MVLGSLGRHYRMDTFRVNAEHKELSWRCECGTAHFITVNWEMWDENYSHLLFEGHYGPVPWRMRFREPRKLLKELKTFWLAAFGRGHYNSWLEVHLTKERAEELARFILTPPEQRTERSP